MFILHHSTLDCMRTASIPSTQVYEKGSPAYSRLVNATFCCFKHANKWVEGGSPS